MLGVINLYKPKGLSSRTAMDEVGRLLPGKVRLGHAGTLDPMAHGVLIVCAGAATRLIDIAQQLPKTYLAEFEFGKRSDTEDITGEVETLEAVPEFSIEELRAVIEQFVGEIMQTPPQFSAVKVDGQRAYALARRGQAAEIPPRQVRVHSIEVVDLALPRVTLRMTTGKGVYVRTLGRDIAKAFRSDAVMTSLERSAIGPFLVENSVRASQCVGDESKWLRPPAELTSHLPQMLIDAAEIHSLRHGRKILQPATFVGPASAAIDERGRLIAILTAEGELCRSKINFAPLLD